MYLDNSFSSGVLKRASATKMVKPISFILMAPKAKTVALVGDFNDWNAESHPLKRRLDGGWSALVELPHGHHRYLFLVDGVPTLDPRAHGVSQQEDQSCTSLLAVS